MSKFLGLYDVRDIMPGDENFILSTFLRGVYYGDTWFSEIPKDIFMSNYKAVADTMVFNRNKTVIKVACLKDDPSTILGYSILSPDYQTIHFVYVKKSWRTQGIAKSLLPQYPTAVTHLTLLGKKLLSKFNSNVVFNPFKI